MPKVKTNSGAKKRFTFTGTGKVKHEAGSRSVVSPLNLLSNILKK